MIYRPKKLEVDTHTHRQTDRHTDTHTHIDTHTHKHTHTQTHRHTRRVDIESHPPRGGCD